MTGLKKEEIITFKADETLAGLLKQIPNRSDFIRKALLQALGNECPLCHGSGALTPNQMNHWERFAKYHSISKCDTCNEFYLICDAVSVTQH